MADSGSTFTCPPMPEMDTSNCIPEFMRQPVHLTAPYKVPDGVEILPIGPSKRRGNITRDFNTVPNEETVCEESNMSEQCPGSISEIETGCNNVADELDELESCSCGCGDFPPPSDPESDNSAYQTEKWDEDINQGSNILEETCESEREESEAKIRSLLKYGCDCSFCKTQPTQSEFTLISDVDLNEEDNIEVKADWIMQTPCECTKCIPKGESSEGEEDVEGECFFPTVTCGECGSTRGQNSGCRMCCFSMHMEEERKRLDYTCTACGTLTDSCRVKDPCIKAPIRREDEFDYDCEGHPIYEGGMSLTRMQHFIWKDAESRGSSGFEQLAYIDCDDDGCDKPEVEAEEDGDCTCAEHRRFLALQNQELEVDGVPVHDYLYSIPFLGKKK